MVDDRGANHCWARRNAKCAPLVTERAKDELVVGRVSDGLDRVGCGRILSHRVDEAEQIQERLAPYSSQGLENLAVVDGLGASTKVLGKVDPRPRALIRQ